MNTCRTTSTNTRVARAAVRALGALIGLLALGCGAAGDDADWAENDAFWGEPGPGGKADSTAQTSFRFKEGTALADATVYATPGSFGTFCYLEVGQDYPLVASPTERRELERGTMIRVDFKEAPLTRQGWTCSIQSGWVMESLIELSSTEPAPAPPPPGTSTSTSSGSPPPGGTGGTDKPVVVTQFLSTFKSWIWGRPYLLGGSCVGSAAGDCSSCPMTVLRNMGLGATGTQADWDSTHFLPCSAGDYRPGDLILVGYSCSNPDHWMALSTVNDRWKANSTSNRIVDQSSDCGPYCGEGPMRPNLAARKVCACARHRTFQQAWSNMP